jgi:hypothetical protein
VAPSLAELGSAGNLAVGATGIGGESTVASGYAIRREDDGTWTVYDRATDMPAVINDIPQIGHSEEDARDVARELDELLDDDEE